jgi:flavin-dependent dehydrogenase
VKSGTINQKSEILIVGGGPAGTSAAIRLAQNGYRVTIAEREKFPRHKLCGEFISPECFAHFRALGVADGLLSAGGDRILETRFYAPGGKSVTVPTEWFSLDQTALGLSRAEMDRQLLERARQSGVRVLEETQVVGLLNDDGRICGVKTKSAELYADLMIDATGRSRVLGKLAEKQIPHPKSKTQNRLVGFKTHLSDVEMEPGRCEIYFFRGGYGGLNYVEKGMGNHCFLIKAEIVKEFGGDAEKILQNVIFQNRRARETMQHSRPTYEWLAVAVDGFGLKSLNPAPNLIAVGDAGAFIDPFTGSGMLMALESGEILAGAVEKNLTTAQIAENYRILHTAKFRQRLRVCRLMRQAAFAPNMAKWIISILSLTEKPRRILARATRPNFSPSEK